VPIHTVSHASAYRQLLNGSGLARDLTRRGIRVQNQAKKNASGRPGPRVDTNNLRGSITHELRTVNGQLVCRVGTNVIYGLYLETGQTRNGKKFPFLVPALKAAKG
jgi:hypothetical protein